MRQKKINPEIMYEDTEIIVCVKPAGVPVQTSRAGETDLTSALKNYRAKKGEEPYIGLIHRLDQPVRGIMVFCQDQGSRRGSFQAGQPAADHQRISGCGLQSRRPGIFAGRRPLPSGHKPHRPPVFPPAAALRPAA